MHEECGVFGVFAHGEDVANLTYFGLYALQHRGQESAGIGVSDGGRISDHKDMGLVSQVFDSGSLADLRGHIAIGHTRYSTTGGAQLPNAQPMRFDHPQVGSFLLAHNGNLTNIQPVRDRLEARASASRPPRTPRSRAAARPDPGRASTRCWPRRFPKSTAPTA